MIRFEGKKYILWDFDGVLINSMAIRTQGFVEVLRQFPENEVALLLQYHEENGGLSRYVKFRYFFEEIRKERISNTHLKTFTDNYSRLMKEKLLEEPLLIQDSISFVKNNFKQYSMHIISGSDGEELRFLCKKLNIAQYFKTIEGSPTPKIKLVENLLTKYAYEPDSVILIGDSINDWEAAEKNNIDFHGYNNLKLKNNGAGYITSFAL